MLRRPNEPLTVPVVQAQTCATEQEFDQTLQNIARVLQIKFVRDDPVYLSLMDGLSWLFANEGTTDLVPDSLAISFDLPGEGMEDRRVVRTLSYGDLKGCFQTTSRKLARYMANYISDYLHLSQRVTRFALKWGFPETLHRYAFDASDGCTTLTGSERHTLATLKKRAINTANYGNMVPRGTSLRYPKPRVEEADAPS